MAYILHPKSQNNFIIEFKYFLVSLDNGELFFATKIIKL